MFVVRFTLITPFVTSFTVCVGLISAPALGCIPLFLRNGFARRVHEALLSRISRSISHLLLDFQSIVAEKPVLFVTIVTDRSQLMHQGLKVGW